MTGSKLGESSATMQGIVRVIEETKIREPLTEANVRGAVKSVAAGRDAWGNEIAYAIRPSSAQSMSYVVVSPGSDGRLDFPTMDSYFTMGFADIRGKGRRDIVFRDGMAITEAGK